MGRYQRASIVAGINDGEVSGAVPGLASHTWSTDPDSVLNLMNLEPFQTNGESLYHHSLSKGPSGAVSRITPVNNENVHSVGAVRPVSVGRLPIIKALLR